MNRMIWQVMASCAFAVAAVATAVAEVPNGAQTSLPEMISSAETTAEHEKIAAYYDAAEKDAKQRAEDHAKLSQAYKSLGGGVAQKMGLAEHCAQLTRSAQNEARDYASLAKAHREMAESAAK